MACVHRIFASFVCGACIFFYWEITGGAWQLLELETENDPAAQSGPRLRKQAETKDHLSKLDYRPRLGDRLPEDSRDLGHEVWRSLQDQPRPTAADALERVLAIKKNSSTSNTLGVIQVGGCDGNWESSNDPMQALLSDERVRALVLEPVPHLWTELSKRLAELPNNAADRLFALNAAVCLATNAAVPFFRVSDKFAADNPEAPHWQRRQLGSFQRSHLRKHRIPDAYIEEIHVPCITAPQAIVKAKTPLVSDITSTDSRVDVLVIDAEGLDGDLVDAFLKVPSFRPAVLVFEQKHLQRPALYRLLERMRELRYVHWRDKDQLVAVLAGPPLSSALNVPAKALSGARLQETVNVQV